LNQTLQFSALWGGGGQVREQPFGLEQRVLSTTIDSKRSRQVEARLEKSRIARDGGPEQSDRPRGVALGKRDKAHICVDHRIVGFNLAPDFERALCAGRVICPQPAIGESECGVG
jgi:hypothetical protein